MDFQCIVAPAIDSTGDVFDSIEAVIAEMKSVDHNDIGSMQSIDAHRGSKTSRATYEAK